MTNNKQCGICADCVPQINGGSGFNNCEEAHAAMSEIPVRTDVIIRMEEVPRANLKDLGEIIERAKERLKADEVNKS
ncbi:hypothetical protein QNN88_01920 [Citrobacter sp. ANG330]|uniref:hypothetical protein n=1 Tax=Citrobacter sp. ANG330 TaxID=3048142 RepID=UPI0039C4E243